MRHIVRQGECAASIAGRYGLSAEELWGRAGNASLRDARPNMHVLAPGDVIDVPERVERPLPFTNGGTQRYRAHVPRTHLRVALRLPSGEAAANKKFEVVTPGSRSPIEGTTDGDGLVDVEIGVHHPRATIRLFLDPDHPVEIPVLLGHLDPIESPSGVRARLQNLGHAAGQGAEGLAAGVRAFQEREELPVTGTLDQETITRLAERHGT